MSDEAHSLRTIDWRTVFPFTQLFRAFRVAIHPAKMVLALLAILLVYGIGRTMDGMWVDRYRAVPGEIEMYESAPSRASFTSAVNSRRTDLKDARAEMARSLSAYDTSKPPLPADASYRQMKHVIEDRRERDVKTANDHYRAAPEKNRTAADARDDEIRAAYARAGSTIDALDATFGRGLCLTFVEFEAQQIDNAARAVVNWDWLGARGVIPSLGRFIFTGPGWAIGKHPLFFTIFTIVALLVWSVIGGAIARIAAVHVSQDEKISVRQALRFSTNKLMSFFAAPLMPLILVGIIALLLAILGWLSEIAYLGGLITIVVGILFFVLIGIGVLVACALVGWVCGFGLMYPTIAVEGSDAFDAVSRSFSYVFARPWKVFIYTVIALVYGAITYLFLRFMVFLTLSVLHECLTFWTGSTGPAGRTSLANAWTGPAGLYELSTGPTSPHGLTLAESIGSSAITFWVWLFVALLGAYLLSFFVSINTIMYYLLRHEVDATDIDDVYLEPGDDEFEDPLPEPATGVAPHAAAGSVPASAMTERVVREPVTPAPTPDHSTLTTPISPGPVTPIASPNEPTSMPATPVTDAGDSARSSDETRGDVLPPPTPPPAGS